MSTPCRIHPLHTLPCPWCERAKLYPCDRCGELKVPYAEFCPHCGLPPNTPTVDLSTVSPVEGGPEAPTYDWQLSNQEFDGLKWAREFSRVTGFADVEWLHVIFANAIMAGYDHARWRPSSAPPPTSEAIHRCSCGQVLCARCQS